MFGTLRYLPNNQTGEFLERASGEAGTALTNKPRHAACDNCRVKKIRCSGQKAGCSRCKTHSLPCRYTHAPAWKCKKKPAFNSRRIIQTNEDENALEFSTAPGQSLPPVATITAVMQPGSLTTEPLLRMPGENHLEPDRRMQQDSGNSNAVVDTTLEEISTWSSCLDWSPAREGTCMSESNFLIADNPLLCSDPLIPGTSYPVPENTAQRQLPLPPLADGLSPPGFLPTPRFNSTHHNRSSSNTSEIAVEEQSSCFCVNSAVLLLDELQAPYCDGGGSGVQSLDCILLTYREVLILSKRMINCDTCRGKSENMMVLTMVLERLVILCGEVIDAFIARQEANVNQPQRLILGEYQIEEGDYEVMMGMLVTRRLSVLQFLLTRMKTISASTSRPHQQARMARVDQHLNSLYQKLRSVCPLVTKWKLDESQSLPEGIVN
ncbi:Zn(II)2Cys6 transcription factor domain-containing protein [Aspergillus aculeatinus CBS 121060]|uniref:Zn(II)2Cys6 transcription factor n=1 Tax=Aspergillus aculeatinus CBS 121060 TaxID=1448322 RepID=A0ACD1H5M8_9EURO|nr:putative Zn(II)2Cys6 transcription factor [Aspergillus aculeatinus CBS 121060]RAH68888.1 putative Zn(II)2Cys6 transcription factor [Aspergillus aculeatinus CBS 121060]